jgi:FkbM family methyltransferase
LAVYLSRAPGMTAIWPWLQVGLVQTRICDGKKIGEIRVPLGRKKDAEIRLDLASPQQRDVFQEVLVERNYPLEKIPFVPDLVVDCGANIGLFSALAAVRFPKAKIVAWEAQQENFAALQNQPVLQSPRVQLVHAAVSDHNGEGFFRGEGAGGRLEIGSAQGGGTKVKILDLREWWMKNKRPKVLWKIDVEGHENTLLPHMAGAWERPCALFLETHEPGGNDGDLIKTLKQDGFQTTLLNEHGLPGEERIFREYFGLLKS